MFNNPDKLNLHLAAGPSFTEYLMRELGLYCLLIPTLIFQLALQKHLLRPKKYNLQALKPIGPLLSVDLPLTMFTFLRMLEVRVLLTVAL
ncbi:hypothetical protein KQI76_02440 [Amphibacillus sp. MSJ-3]|uniref:hypothetical protein n=1 Tax=Amphibacillus sp. MSJ-3 TaxID=2841505 RepID=UPI001C0E99D2|nr:hypothetical protein [Amphibacillus sp. MSJ-3]MBU5594011.1 hypothetical protein [Amphibacillus sp. MSJ-3]